MIKETEPKRAYCSKCGIYMTLPPGVLKLPCPKCGRVCGVKEENRPITQRLKDGVPRWKL